MNLSKTTKSIDDSKDIATVQVTFQGIVINACIVEPRGYHSKVETGKHGILLEISQNQYFFLPIENIDRPKDLEDGENAVGNFATNCMIKFLNNGSILIKNNSGSIELDSSGNIILNAGINNGVQYQALNIALQSLISLINIELGKIATAVPAYNITKTDLVQDFTTSMLIDVKVK
jgi:hypothetical protein